MKSSGGRIVDIEVAAVAIKADIFIYYNLELNELKKKKKNLQPGQTYRWLLQIPFFLLFENKISYNLLIKHK